MPPKKTATTASKKTGTTAQHSSYRDMIKDAIQNLKERNGSSRQSIKKYVQANNKVTVASPAAFDAQFNKAIKAGVEKGEFTQPKEGNRHQDCRVQGRPSEGRPSEAAAPKPAAAKKTATKKTEKPAAKTTTKKAGTTTKKSAGRPKANTAKPRESPTVAPAVVEQPKVIRTTKSGRVTKTNASPAAKTDKSAAAGRRSAPKKRT
ncbi:hypothetical protein PHISP_06936 [Aspergillus sp. HF37]|nr:hypothetical protein PHISP_06936 [Aspergillus sp. HF37]